MSDVILDYKARKERYIRAVLDLAAVAAGTERFIKSLLTDWTLAAPRSPDANRPAPWTTYQMSATPFESAAWPSAEILTAKFAEADAAWSDLETYFSNLSADHQQELQTPVQVHRNAVGEARKGR